MNKTFLYALCGVLASSDALADDVLDNLGNLSLENLGNVVTSVSKKPEDSFRSAAAIYVITNEDIKLSGATHIAEALRGVPGLDVAQVDSSNWAISSRGFSAYYANKLLVLVDGRTIYTPNNSGVYWDIQNIPLEDIERIEVIRGPGAALWGSNAVNGVINIITKSAADTQGAYASETVGTQERSLTDLRYGGKIDGDIYYRTYAKYDDHATTHTTTGLNGNNSWDAGKVGFRTDWNQSSDSKFTVQGDAYQDSINLNLSVPDLSKASLVNSFADVLHSSGANTLGRWEVKNGADIQSTVQLYEDYQSRDYSSFKQQINTADFDYQTDWKVNRINDVTWGAGMRFINADLTGSETLATADTHATQQIYSAFIQDQIALVQKELYLTLGSKIEKNTLVGVVPEPSARIAWSPDSKQTVWAAVSHAERTPSLAERELLINIQASPPAMVQQQYNKDFESEELTAYEVGYRVKPTQKFSVDSTAFVNDYTRLRTFEPGAYQFPVSGGIIAPYTVSNLGSGHSFGFETSIMWDVTSNWNLLANYSYINLLLDKNTSQDPTFLNVEGQTPHNQFMIRSQLFLPHEVQLVNALYYVDKLPADSIGSYFRFDTQIIWQPTKGLEVSFVGQNLLENKHPEFGAPLDGVANDIPRAFYAKVSSRF